MSRLVRIESNLRLVCSSFLYFDLTEEPHDVEVSGGEAEQVHLPGDALLRALLLGVHCLQRHEAALGVLGEVNLGTERWN